MATDMENDSASKECPESVVKKFATELEELFNYRDLFFVYNPVEMAVKKNTIVEEKRDALLEKFEAVDVDTDIPAELRAEFLYLKGRCYNIVPNYEPKAVQCLSRAVKLNPRMVHAWNELGECYWKNLNIKDAKFSFEGALQHERNRVSLRCLSIILRQEVSGKSMKDAAAAILKSVEYAKEAVSQEYKDGLSWSILGNAYLCQYFMVAQHPTTLKLCMSAYKQAYQDPIARGQPDLYYNKGIALKYEECYPDAVESFETACRLDPPWHPPKQELNKLMKYLNGINDLVRTKGKIKPKKLSTMVKAIDERMLGCYGPGSVLQIGKREKVTLTWVPLSQLKEGTNEGLVVAAVVLGSIHSHNSVPFTFAVTDNSGHCFSVTVYNWANGRGAIIGDVIAIPEPIVKVQQEKSDKLNYDFKAIRVNNPTTLVMNGRKVGRNQFACTKVTSTCELLLRSGLNGVMIE